MTEVAQTPGDLIILSDLHLGRGKNPATGRYHALEAFFFDDDFGRFCHYLCEDAERRRAPFTLVLNGDCFDLLRAEPNRSGLAGVFLAGELPERGSDQQLARIMCRILDGHPGFVRALAHVLRAGHRVVILPGNHDIDIQRPAVQAEIKTALRAALAVHCLEQEVDEALARVLIEPWFYYEPGRVWIEHGSQYDPEGCFRYQLRASLNEPDARFVAEHDLPLGNFFQRYLYNGFGNITFIVPSSEANLRYLKWLVLNQPRLLFGALARHVPFAFRVLVRMARAVTPDPKSLDDEHAQLLSEHGQAWGLGSRLTVIDRMKASETDLLRAIRSATIQVLRSISIAAILALLGVALWFGGFLAINQLQSGFGLKTLLFLALNLFMFVLPVGGVVLMLLRSLPAAPTLPLQIAATRLSEIADVPMVVFGHTHVETLIAFGREDGSPAWYVNTGTWIAVFTHDVLLPRERVQYTFLRIRDDHPELLHWSPGRGEALEVILLDPLGADEREVTES